MYISLIELVIEIDYSLRPTPQHVQGPDLLLNGLTFVHL